MDLSELLEDSNKDLVIIYPGRFHPFHIGHGKVYQYLKQKYSNAQVFISTSGKTDGDRSPFTFEEKRKMMILAGVDSGAIVQCKSPYQSVEIMERFDKDKTVVVFAISEKDMAEEPRFDFSGGIKLKKNGEPAYMQKWVDLDTAETFDTRGYIATTPTFKFKVRGQEINSASQIRNMVAASDDTKLTQMLQDLYSISDVPADVIEIFKRKIGNKETMNENWDEDSFSEFLKENVNKDNIMKTGILTAITEGKSPHKKGTKKYNTHMAAIHAESIDEEFDRKVEEVVESKFDIKESLKSVAADMKGYVDDHKEHFDAYPMDVEVDDKIYDWDEYWAILDKVYPDAYDNQYAVEGVVTEASIDDLPQKIKDWLSNYPTGEGEYAFAKGIPNTEANNKIINSIAKIVPIRKRYRAKSKPGYDRPRMYAHKDHADTIALYVRESIEEGSYANEQHEQLEYIHHVLQECGDGNVDNAMVDQAIAFVEDIREQHFDDEGSTKSESVKVEEDKYSDLNPTNKFGYFGGPGFYSNDGSTYTEPHYDDFDIKQHNRDNPEDKIKLNNWDDFNLKMRYHKKDGKRVQGYGGMGYNVSFHGNPKDVEAFAMKNLDAERYSGDNIPESVEMFSKDASKRDRQNARAKEKEDRRLTPAEREKRSWAMVASKDYDNEQLIKEGKYPTSQIQKRLELVDLYCKNIIEYIDEINHDNLSEMAHRIQDTVNDIRGKVLDVTVESVNEGTSYKGYDIKRQNRKDGHPLIVPALKLTGANMKDIKQMIDRHLDVDEGLAATIGQGIDNLAVGAGKMIKKGAKKAAPHVKKAAKDLGNAGVDATKKGLKKLSKLGSKNTSSSFDGKGNATTNTTYGMANAREGVNQDQSPESIEQMQEIYKYNEERNNHSGNILMLAHAFGDRGEIRAVEGLLKIIKRQGHTTPEQSEMMYNAIHKKYIDELFPAENEGNEFGGELAKAKIDGKKEFKVDGKTYKVKEGLSKLIDNQKSESILHYSDAKGTRKYSEGYKAAKDGVKYDENPYSGIEKLQWSRGHNDERADRLSAAGEPNYGARGQFESK